MRALIAARGRRCDGDLPLVTSGIKRGLFLRIEAVARNHYRLVFLSALLLVALSLFLGSRLELDGDILNLVPRDNPVVNSFREALQEFGSLDYLLLLLEAPEGQGAEELEEFADRLAERLQRLDSMRYVEHRIDPSGPFFDFFRRNQVLFLSPEKLDELRAKFGDAGIRARVRDNLHQLTGANSFFVKQLLEQDPFLISPLLFEQVLRGSGPLKADVNGGYYVARDGSALLLIAKPVKPAQDLAFDRTLMDQVQAAVDEVSRQSEAEQQAATRDTDADAETDGASAATAEPAGDTATPTPRVSFGGGYVIALDDSKLILQSLVRNGTLSFVAIVLLYFFCYRRLAAILYSSVPLITGQCLSLAVAFIFLRQLNSATTGFTAMLMGLGTDFTIVMYARYIEERRHGCTMPEALQRMMGATAFGVFTGAITSAGTFYSMCITEYRGLRDFGFLVGSGILLCLVAILFLLPAMIAWNESRRPHEEVRRRLYLHSFGIERAIDWSTRRPWPVLIGSALLTLAAGWLAWNVEFSDSVQDLRSPSNRGVVTQEIISRKFGATFMPMMVLCRAGDLETLIQRNRDANRRLDSLVADGTLRGYESILTYLPPREDQEKVIRALNEGAGADFDLGRIERTFRAALRENGFREEVYEPYISTLSATLRPQRPVTLDDLRSAGLGRFVDRYVRQAADGTTKAVTYVFPAAESARRTAPPALMRAFEDAGPGVEITGINIASAELRRLFRRDAWRAVLLGLSVVTLLLWLDFRSVWLTLLANTQVLAGVIWMLAAMRLLDLKMNFINAFVTTMILGVGIDYGIHIIHRISQEGLSNREGLLETGKAVVMAALTNVAGFGTLGMSAYPGLASMGIVCAIGSVTCLITAITTLPALLILTRTRTSPAAPPPGG